MKKYINLFMCFFIILLISCESIEDKEKKQQNKINLKNEIEIKHLSEKYKAVRVSKPINSYTYHLQETFIDNKKLICFEGNLKDITKTDSSFILKVSIEEVDTNYLALISVNPSKFLEIKKILETNNLSREGCFIFKVSKIYSFKPVFKDEDILDPEGNSGESIMTFDFDCSVLYFKGNLIDFYLNETNN